MKKTRLKIDYDYGFCLIGIVSIVKEYKLAWDLNQSLNINLVKQGDIAIPKTNENDLLISNLLFETENSTLRLIGNRSISEENEEKAILLPELQNFTHFFLIQDEAETFQRDRMIEKMKGIGSIDYVVGIEPDKLKNKDNLIF